MPSLHPNLRNLLEKSVITAREESEKAARAALTRLAVHQEEAYAALSAEERALRNQLRAEARRLGSFEALAAECAYEQWHRMLFARFLAENHLLIHPETGVPVTLEECAELAPEEGEPDGWMVAARYAARMLPGVFRNDDPVLKVRFAAEGRQSLQGLLGSLPSEVFTADDSLGWVYQFWQAKSKEAVNKSGRKIGGADIAPVTQLFTEHYMVQFLLHNSLGAWWAAQHPGEPLPVDLEYLRLKEGFGPHPRPLPEAGRGVNGGASPALELDRQGFGFKPGGDDEAASPSPRFGERARGEGSPAVGSAWPTRAAHLRILDPCCGSGHFLTAAFDLLVRFRMIEEGFNEREAGDAVLRDNLFGLELDPRCAQIAAFNLALTAWKAGGYRALPQPNIACSGLQVGDRLYEWTQLAGKDAELEAMMRRLYHLFRDAPDLGSLVDPARVASDEGLFAIEWDRIGPLLERVLAKEREQDDPAAIFGAAAQGAARAADLLARKYHLVITNVPYLARGKQAEKLRQFIETWHTEAKADLATAFVERCLSFCAPGGSIALVTPQNWLFLTTYRKMRERLLQQKTWNVVAKLGENGFESPQAAGAFTALFVLTNATPSSDQMLAGIEASAPRVPAEKAELLRCGEVQIVSQTGQLKNPDARVALEENKQSKLLEAYARSYKGVTSGDDPRFCRKFWEMPALPEGWRYLQSTVSENAFYSGLSNIEWFSAMDGMPGVYIRAAETWGKRGVAVSQMRKLPCSLSVGEPFDTNTAVILPHNPSHLPAIWAFCSSAEYNAAVRRVDQALKVTNATLVKIPFDLEKWQQKAEELYPDGLPEPYSEDPTQWLFDGDPARSTEPLQVGVARLLGYRWPSDLTPPPAPPRSGEGSHRGAFSLSPFRGEGQGRGVQEDAFADRDGIVCLPAVAGEPPAAERLRALLATAYGPDWTPAVQEKLLAEAGFGGKGLEEWMRDGFFIQHCKLFHNRPFIWHLWDGRKDGFAALVNYHMLDRSRLERLTYTYLGAWIGAQREADSRGEAGANARLVSALGLQEKLKAILEGEPPYDIYVRWKPLHRQSIGWEPDINDGVRINIRPFVMAGALRARFTINWNKDRGTNPDGSERINDRHVTREEKEV